MLWPRRSTPEGNQHVSLQHTDGGTTAPDRTKPTKIASEADIDRSQKAMGLQNQLVTVYANSKTHLRHCESRFKPTQKEWIDANAAFEEVRKLCDRSTVFERPTGTEVDASQVADEEAWINDATEFLKKPRLDPVDQWLKDTIAKNDKEAARAAASARSAEGGLGSLNGSTGEVPD